jgi:NADPH:quinone reductase-like Zn-dependent oxidoreductase
MITIQIARRSQTEINVLVRSDKKTDPIESHLATQTVEMLKDEVEAIRQLSESQLNLTVLELPER